MLISPQTTMVPPGSPPEHPIVSVVEAQKAFPGIMSPVALLAIALWSV